MSALSRRAVSVVTLGRMGFMAAYDVQLRYARQHLEEMAGKPHVQGENTLLLVEHTPVYTVGIRAKDYTPEDERRLKQTGAEFCRTNRGGLITFHGPGQLVAYPVLNLQKFNPSMKWYVGQLEQTLIKTLQRFGLSGRTTDQTGVWVDDRKIASIGLHGSRYVTTHGVSLNCDVDLSWFEQVTPCGLEGVEMTSLSRELEHPVPYQDAIKPFLRSFQDVFDCELEFKMLDEGELKSMGVQHSAQSDRDSHATLGNSGMPKQAELGLRRMSTSSSRPIPAQEEAPKVMPMW
ncbi:putative lipoyltransferase 2, mitochondrial [Aplysia californica]|uniref:lipoyl(octanoyl) transferase n=1 Tax=Aplysia californica TaxID=6500 RepID=A0ABM0JD31_APLCA|nr:putative lipoyltransferase 2, mitochondrial [Aplysia californica]